MPTKLDLRALCVAADAYLVKLHGHGLAPAARDTLERLHDNAVAYWPGGAVTLPFDPRAKDWRDRAVTCATWDLIRAALVINAGALTKALSQVIVLGSTAPGPLEDWLRSLSAEDAAKPAPGEDAAGAAKQAAAPAAAPAAGPVDVDVDAEAEATLGRVFGALGGGDMGAARATVRDVIAAREAARAEARKAREDAEAAREAAAHASVAAPITGPVRPTGTTTLHDLTPPALRGELSPRAARLTLRTWSGAGSPDPHYSPDPAALEALAACDGRGLHAWLTGPAGTGKSSLPEWYAAKLGRPFVRVVFDRSTEPEDLIGGMEPDGQGGMAWRDGALARAIRQPGTVILLDEPTFARPAALAMLQSLLDGGRHLLARATGERIAMAPGVMICAADNTAGTGDESGQYAGTAPMNRALLDRMAARITVGYLPPEREREVLARRSGIPQGAATLMIAYAHRTRAAAANGDLAHALGLRRLIAWAELVGAGMRSERAFAMTCLVGEAPDDAETLRQLERAHVDHAKVDQLAATAAPPAV